MKNIARWLNLFKWTDHIHEITINSNSIYFLVHRPIAFRKRGKKTIYLLHEPRSTLYNTNIASFTGYRAQHIQYLGQDEFYSALDKFIKKIILTAAQQIAVERITNHGDMENGTHG